jgi:hypothetical protein
LKIGCSHFSESPSSIPYFYNGFVYGNYRVKKQAERIPARKERDRDITLATQKQEHFGDHSPNFEETR